jgi:predicted GNAT superfamily acetyltransferase
MSATLQIIEVESTTEAEAMAEFFKTIWSDGDDVVPFDLILAVVHVGGYAAIAKSENKIVAASFGFLGEFASHQILHSHVTAANLAGAGLALKRHQFEWAKDRDLGGITWTFDPLVRRNCVFNFEKLRALAVEYLPNFYGSLTDTINAGDDSDRLFAYWPINETVETERARTSALALRNVDGRPVAQSFDAENAFWVELPEDIEALRKSDIELAKEWRKSVRQVLQPALDAGWFIGAVNDDRTAILVEPSGSDYEFSEE